MTRTWRGKGRGHWRRRLSLRRVKRALGKLQPLSRTCATRYCDTAPQASACHAHVSATRAALELVVPHNLDLAEGVGGGCINLQQLGQAAEEQWHEHVCCDSHAARDLQLWRCGQAHGLEGGAHLCGDVGANRNRRSSDAAASRYRQQRALTAPTSPTAAISGLLNALPPRINK